MFAAFSSSFMTTPGITSRIQLMLSLYGRTWIRENSSSRCSPRMDAYRMFVSTPRIRSSYSASRFAVAVSPIGSTKPAQRRAEFSQSRYSGESSSALTRNAVGVPRMSTSGNSSFEPPVPREATVIRSIRPLIAPSASCIAGNSAICPFSRSSRKLMSTLGEEPVHHPFRVEGSDVLVRLPEVHERDGGGIRPRLVFDQFEADRLRVFLELLDGPRPERVRGGDDARVALLLNVVGQFRDRRRLARAVDPDEHDNEGSRGFPEECEEIQRRDG